MRLRKHLDPDGGDESPRRQDAQVAHRLPGRTRPGIRRLGSLVTDRADRLDDKFIIGRLLAEPLKDRIRVVEWPYLHPVNAHRSGRKEEIAERLVVTRSNTGVVRLYVGGEQLFGSAHRPLSVALRVAAGWGDVS